MAQIMPFRGLFYNPEKIEDIKAVVAPPYDVISQDMQDMLYHRHPDNIVRLILGKTYPDDTPTKNRYTRASLDFKRWRSERVLVLDERPSIYYYVQTYILKSRLKKTRKGFIARSRLEEFGKGSIHPHEKTLSGPKADRLRLTEACRANFSCIFSLYSQPDLEINGLLEDSINDIPIIDVVDDEGITNKVWKVDDQFFIESIAKDIANKPLFIADGHHRYETALNYRNLIRERANTWTGNEPENYVMMYFSNMDDEGITILPTHRVVHSIPNFDSKAFLLDCSTYFNIEKIEFNEKIEPRVRKEFFVRMEEMADIPQSFGLYMEGVNAYYILTLKNRGIIDREIADTIPEAFKEMDVSLLHSLILDKILGISVKAQEGQRNLIYEKDSDAAINAVNEKCQLAFLLKPTKIEQIKRVSEAGHVMPQKSTYFYPKLLSGLVINPLE
ncbi:MAG: DUF1015 domain-containing protein [Thermodesulfobacteriota bacterium]